MTHFRTANRRRRRRTSSWLVAGTAVVSVIALTGCGAGSNSNGTGSSSVELSNTVKSAINTVPASTSNSAAGTDKQVADSTNASAGGSSQPGSTASATTTGSAATGQGTTSGSSSGATNGVSNQDSGATGYKDSGAQNTASPSIGQNATAGGTGQKTTVTATGTPANSVVNGSYQVSAVPMAQLTAYGLQAVANFSPASMVFVDKQHGFIAGTDKILGTADGGHSWRLLYTAEGPVLQLDFISSEVGYALMASGTNSTGQPTGLRLWQTTDGGVTWASVGPGTAKLFDGLSAGQQIRMHFTDSQHGVIEITGSNEQSAQSGQSQTPSATFYMTSDGATTWVQLPAPAGAQSVAYSNAVNGVALVADAKGFSVEWTKDAGKTWTTVFQKAFKYQVTGRVWMPAADSAFVQIFGGYGMTQQSYTLIHTSDAGGHWDTLIANATAGGGAAPGEPQASQSTMGPGLIPGKLDVLDANNAVLSGAIIPAGQYGVVSVGATSDGVHWQNMTENMPGQQGLVSFVTPKDGWLVTTANQRFADVFATTDGGATWHETYQFLLAEDAAQNGRVTPLSYSQAQLAKIAATEKTDGVSLYLPTAGLDNEKFQIVKTNGDGSIGLVYDHIWVIESSQPIPQVAPTSYDVQFDEQLANGNLARYVESANSTGGLDKFLYFQIGNTYVSITYLQQNSPYSDRQLVQVAESFSALTK